MSVTSAGSRPAGHYARYNATAPIAASSGPKVRHRLNPRGNRHLNHALHIAAIAQIGHDTPGRVFFERKLAEGKTRKEARRALKRRISDAVYRQLLADARRCTDGPGRANGTTLSQRGRLHTLRPALRTSHSRTHQQRYVLYFSAPSNSSLTTNRHRFARHSGSYDAGCQSAGTQSGVPGVTSRGGSDGAPVSAPIP